MLSPSNKQMYFSLLGISGLCTIIIISVYFFTKPIIEDNLQQQLERAIFSILPGTVFKNAYIKINENTLEKVAKIKKPQTPIYAAYDLNHQLLGFAITAQGMGYQDNIQLLYAYDAKKQKITGMTVLQSRETPGLGSKIIDDKGFLDNFTQLDVQLNADNKQLKQIIEVVKPGKKTEAWQIDGISGATVSSKAVGQIIQKSISYWAPIIQINIKQISNEQ